MEKLLEIKINNYCKRLGLKTTKFIDQSRRGAPDRIVWFDGGVTLFVETKYKSNGPSRHQIAYQKWLENIGHPVIMAREFGPVKAEIDRIYALCLNA